MRETSWSSINPALGGRGSRRSSGADVCQANAGLQSDEARAVLLPWGYVVAGAAGGS
jgi:hypothetical protein